MQHLFFAFRLPSPLSVTTDGVDFEGERDRTLKIEARDGIMKLLALGGLQDTHVYQELLALLPSAEAHHQAGATIREAWARASADFQELVAEGG